MKKLIGVLFIAAAACVPGTAQQENKASIDTAPAAIETKQVVPIQPGFRFVIEFPLPGFKTEVARRIQIPPEGFMVSQPQWVFRDGALYIDISGTGILVPVPGGGASGCFDLNLEERIAKLRARIEAFPPRPN